MFQGSRDQTHAVIPAKVSKGKGQIKQQWAKSKEVTRRRLGAGYAVSLERKNAAALRRWDRSEPQK
jgi:hypothetical protein